MKTTTDIPNNCLNDPEESDDRCAACYRGQVDVHDWLEVCSDNPEETALTVFAALDALSTGDLVLPKIPESLRDLFRRRIECGELQASDEPCWRSGVAMGLETVTRQILLGAIGRSAGDAVAHDENSFLGPVFSEVGEG